LTIKETVKLSCIYRDAIIRLTACFGKGKHQLHHEEVFLNHPDAMSYFKEQVDIRNSFIAHNHGPQRQCKIGVAINEDGSIGRLHYLRNVLYHGSREEFQSLLEILDMAGVAINERISRLTKQTEAYIMILTVDEISELRDITITVAEREHFPLSRSQYRTSNENIELPDQKS